MRKNNSNLPSREPIDLPKGSTSSDSLPNNKQEKRKHKEVDETFKEENRNKLSKSEDSLAILEPVENSPHYSFIMDLKVSNTKMAKAELCGLHLAEKMKEMGADMIIRECKAQTLKA